MKRSTLLALVGLVPGLLLTAAAPAHATSPGAFSRQIGNLRSTSPTDFSTAHTARSLRDMKTVGFTGATFIVPVQQSSDESCDLHPVPTTPTDASLATGFDSARAAGLNPSMIIHLGLPDGSWRANIRPADRDCWFGAWQDLEVHYARLAQAHHVKLFSLGAEMYGVTSATVDPDNTRRWRSIIAAVRQVYSGTLAYDAQRPFAGNDEFTGIAWWGSVDLIQVSAYVAYGVDPAMPSSQVDPVLRSLEVQLQAAHDTYHKPVMFGEFGVSSEVDARLHPWVSYTDGTPDMQEQARYYQVSMAYWSQVPWFVGMDLWDWKTDGSRGGTQDVGFTVQHKPAEAVVASWFGGSVPAGA